MCFAWGYQNREKKISLFQVAQNPQGHVQVSAQVDVRETPGIDETSYVQPDAFKYIEKQLIAPRPGKPTRRESDTTNLQQKPAKILKTPMSTSVVEGSTATFTCQVEGSPKPKVTSINNHIVFEKSNFPFSRLLGWKIINL